MYQIYFMGACGFDPATAEFVVGCDRHQTYVHFFLSALEIMDYRGSVEELKQVAAHHALLSHCEGCKREQVPSLPEAS